MEQGVISDRTKQIALLVSLSCVLQIMESAVPHPIPGLRLGLANMLSLVALVTLGFRAALQVSILRTVLSSFLMGTFMSPTFVLSFSAGVAATCVMGLLYRASGSARRYRFSLIGISVFGALCHNTVQLLLAYLLLVRHKGVFVFLPYLVLGAVATGWITGAIARAVCLRLEKPEDFKPSSFPLKAPGRTFSGFYVEGSSLVHRLSGELKILLTLFISILLVITTDAPVLMFLTAFLIIAVLSSNVPFSSLIRRSRRCFFLILTAFLIPVFMHGSGEALFETAFITITREGVIQGFRFAFRLYYLIILSLLLTATTSPKELTGSLTILLGFLKFFRISPMKTALTLSMAWNAVPYLWEAARAGVRKENLSKIKGIGPLIGSVGSWIAGLYVMAENMSAEDEASFPVSHMGPKPDNPEEGRAGTSQARASGEENCS